MKFYTRIEKVLHKYSILTFLIFLCISICMVCRNFSRYTPFIDYSYQVEGAYRICNGLLPYRDFVLVTAPGTYFLLAGFLKVFGLSNLGCIALVMVNQIVGMWLIYRIVTCISDSSTLIVIVLGICAFTGCVTFPFAHYNHLCTVMMIAAIYFIVSYEFKTHNKWLLFGAGFASCLSMCFKQNYGFFFMIGVVIWAIYKISKREKNYFFVLAGIIAVVFSGLVYIILTKTPIQSIWYDMFEFPSQSRSVISAYLNVIKLLFNKNFGGLCFLTFGIIMLAFFIKNRFLRFFVALPIIPLWLWWTYRVTPYTNISSWYLITLLAIFCLIYSCVSDKRFISEKNVLILCFLVYVVGICSQEMNGSPYILVLALIYLNQFYKKQFSSFVIFFFSLSYMLCSVYFAVRIPGLYGFDVSNVTEVKSLSDRYFGLHADASALNDLLEITTYVDNVIQESSFVELPGEDPIYWGTSTKPQLDFFQMHPQTCPYSLEEIEKNIFDSGIEYVIIKTSISEGVWLYNPSDVPEIIRNLEAYGYDEFELLDHYVVLKKK